MKFLQAITLCFVADLVCSIGPWMYYPHGGSSGSAPAPASVPLVLETPPEDTCTVHRDLSLEVADVCVDLNAICPGRRLVITGEVCPNPDRFSVELLTEEGIALHMDVRFNWMNWENIIVFNSKLGEEWGGQIDQQYSYGDFPFVRGPYSIGIAFPADDFIMISSNERPLKEIQLREPFKASGIKRLCVSKCNRAFNAQLRNM